MQKGDLFGVCCMPMTKEPVNNSMKFYFSMAQQLSLITNPEMYRIAQQSIYNYAFYGDPFPDVDDVLVKSIFISVKPLIDKYIGDYTNGGKGGRPPKAKKAENEDEKPG